MYKHQLKKEEREIIEQLPIIGKNIDNILLDFDEYVNAAFNDIGTFESMDEALKRAMELKFNGFLLGINCLLNQNSNFNKNYISDSIVELTS